MAVEFQLGFISTIIIIRDYQGKVVKTSKKLPEEFYNMEFLGNNTYRDRKNETVWSKKTSSIVNDGQFYFQEEYTDITDLWNQRQKLLCELERDFLTQISNIRAVEAKKKEILSSGESCVLVMCDINSFKTINDVYGHVIGDQCLTETAQLFSRFITSRDLVARVGGDEFFFIFLTDDVDAVKETMNTIQQEVEILGASLNLPLSISAGVSLFQKGDNWYKKREDADFVSYRNKELIKQKLSGPKA